MIEDGTDGRRLKLNVQENPQNATAMVSLPLPESTVGTSVYLSFKLDWDPGMWSTLYYANTTYSRAQGTLTAALIEDVIAGSFAHFLILGSDGSVYLSDVALVQAWTGSVCAPDAAP